MKREFGKKLITEVLPRWNLTRVENTSGAFIPGHGTPTVLLFGSSEPPRTGDVHVILASRGEPSTPVDPARGVVWSSIADHGDEAGFENEYITVARMNRAVLAQHPWSLGGGGASELKEILEARAATTLGDLATAIGFGAVTREDDVYLLDAGALARLHVPDEMQRQLVVGEEVRDWSVAGGPNALWPYDAKTLEPRVGSEDMRRFLWRYRTQLARRVAYGQTQLERGLPWFAYSMFFTERFRGPFRIGFAFVATHNHFVLDRGSRIFNRTAPIITLAEGATEDDHLALLAYLNSSTACFWMKQVFFDKGSGTDRGKWQSEKAKIAYEFAGTGMEGLPIPPFSDTTRRRLVDLARRLSELAGARHECVAAVVNSSSPADWDVNKSRDAELLEEAIALQEEVDWLIYESFGLAPADCVGSVERGARLTLGARAFEAALAQTGKSVGIDGQSLSPHPAPIPSLDVANARVAAMKRPEIATVEDPLYKRRWLSTPKELAGRVETFEDRAGRAIGDHLANEVEAALKSVVLAPTPVAARLVETSGTWASLVRRLSPVIEGARLPCALDSRVYLERDSVPFSAALRFSESGLEKLREWTRTWDAQREEDAGARVAPKVPPKYQPKDFAKERYEELRGKLDVPKERFISYPGCESDEDGEPVYGWAGWNHLEQAQALAALYNDRKDREGWAKERLLPMLTGILELLPWVKQWHNEPSADFDGLRLGDYFEGFLQGQMRELGFTEDDLRAWRPMKAARAARSPRPASEAVASPPKTAKPASKRGKKAVPTA